MVKRIFLNVIAGVAGVLVLAVADHGYGVRPDVSELLVLVLAWLATWLVLRVKIHVH